MNNITPPIPVMPADGNRLHLVDALRGFAILSIMLLHNIEHFDFLYFPEALPAWMKTIDKGVMDSMYFLFGGKSYAIFSLLFGLTFSIQAANQEKKGRDFRGRFAWRLILLLGFGFINSAFYEGDILMFYAILGFTLIPVARLSNRAVFGIAMLLMIQPYQWYEVYRGILNPAMQMSDPGSWALFGKMSEYVTKDSLIDTFVGNLTNGRHAVSLWMWETGRVFQTSSLFMLGMLAGRLSLFSSVPGKTAVWRKILLWSVAAFVVLYSLGRMIPVWIASKAINSPLGNIWGSWSNMAFMLILVSGFSLLYQTRFLHRTLDALSPIGRMSLSNYLFQSLVGTTLYYGFGFGLYKYTGASYCLLIGIVLAVMQCYLSHWWLKRHKQGPLETIWHKLTWLRSE